MDMDIYPACYVIVSQDTHVLNSAWPQAARGSHQSSCTTARLKCREQARELACTHSAHAWLECAHIAPHTLRLGMAGMYTLSTAHITLSQGAGMHISSFGVAGMHSLRSGLAGIHAHCALAACSQGPGTKAGTRTCPHILGQAGGTDENVTIRATNNPDDPLGFKLQGDSGGNLMPHRLCAEDGSDSAPCPPMLGCNIDCRIHAMLHPCIAAELQSWQGGSAY
eukprot:232024-Pelagomonas_calceolata.AAC.1